MGAWAVELAGQAAMAEPAHQGARDLLADGYEQLGYQSEGPQWRSLYLTAAQELRDGEPTSGGMDSASADLTLTVTKAQLAGALTQ